MDFQAQKSTAGAGNPHLSAHVSIALLQLSHSLLLGLAPPETWCSTCCVFHLCQILLLREGFQVGYPLGGAVPQSLFVMAPTPLSKTFIGDQELNPRQHHLK